MNVARRMPKNPIVGMVYFDSPTSTMHVFNGAAWCPVNVENPKRCMICDRTFHYTADHPFCSDNLLYLEWMEKKKHG